MLKWGWAQGGSGIDRVREGMGDKGMRGEEKGKVNQEHVGEEKETKSDRSVDCNNKGSWDVEGSLAPNDSLTTTKNLKAEYLSTFIIVVFLGIVRYYFPKNLLENFPPKRISKRSLKDMIL